MWTYQSGRRISTKFSALGAKRLWVFKVRVREYLIFEHLKIVQGQVFKSIIKLTAPSNVYLIPINNRRALW